MTRASALLLIALLAGCSKPPVPAKSQLPQFARKVGHLENEGGLMEFVQKYAGNTVDLDITIPDAEFEGGADGFFTLFDDCEGLAENEKPRVIACTGTTYSLPKSVIKREGGARHIRGHFRPGKMEGPLQGLMSVSLTPVD